MSRLGLVWLLASGCGALAQVPPQEADPGSDPTIRPGSPLDEIHHVYRMARALGYQEVSSPEITNLRGGLQASTVLLQRTRWILRDPGQSVLGDLRRRASYLRLPEKERLRHMDRTDDFIQIWWMAATQSGATPSNASSLVPTDRPHRAHREAVLLGWDERSTYYAFAPIPEWIQLQRLERLRGGEDPRRAALRGLGVKDADGYTAFACYDLLGQWGQEALPLVEEAIAKGRPERGSAVRALGRMSDAAVGSALVRWAGSPDAAVAGAARRALIENPRLEAKALYAAWLAADAGAKPVAPLLNALLAISVEAGAEPLGRILASPQSVYEYRLAFTLTRKVSGRPVPKILLDAEGVLRRAGTPGALAAGGQARVDQAVMVILTVGDAEAAAVVGLSLAMTALKGGGPAVPRAGVAVLKRLPGKAGERLVTHLARTLRGTDLLQVQKVAAAVRGLGEL